MGRLARDLVDLDDDSYPEDQYFTYRPLSNLPTPPPSSRNSSVDQSPDMALEEGESLQDRFLGPAVHLVNLVPAPASLAASSVPLVQALLSRTNLPLETVALGACILDSLNSKFALSWRLQCPLIPDMLAANKRHSLAGPFMQQPQTHIDSVQPELIVLAALVIAAKFTDDRQDSTQYYCASWGRHLWSCSQLNVTERVIYENLGWRIKPLLDDDDLIADTLVDMQRAVGHYRPAAAPTASSAPTAAGSTTAASAAAGRRHPPPPVLRNLGGAAAASSSHHSKSQSMSVGTAVMGLGLQLTPVETPRCDDEDGGDSNAPASDYLSLPARSVAQGLSPVGEEVQGP